MNGIPDSDSSLFPEFDTCPRCGNIGLEAVNAGGEANFACKACQSCWHVELGWVHEVDPKTCPSCQSRGVCAGLVIDLTEQEVPAQG